MRRRWHDSTTDSNSYYKIEAWGIKVALRDADKVDLKIDDKQGELIGTDPFNGVAEPQFKDSALEDKTCTPGVALYRSKTSFSSFASTEQKVGDYYYVVTGGPGSCSDDPANNPDDQLKTRFLEDFKPSNISLI